MVGQLTGVAPVEGLEGEGGQWAAKLADSALPPNPTLEKLPAALAAAHEHYKQVHGVENAVVVFVVQPGEKNVVDQRLLELKLWQGEYDRQKKSWQF